MTKIWEEITIITKMIRGFELRYIVFNLCTTDFCLIRWFHFYHRLLETAGDSFVLASSCHRLSRQFFAIWFPRLGSSLRRRSRSAFMFSRSFNRNSSLSRVGSGANAEKRVLVCPFDSSCSGGGCGGVGVYDGKTGPPFPSLEDSFKAKPGLWNRWNS